MILIDSLQKPYTSNEREQFAGKYMYGYELRETETALEVWDYTEEEKEQQRQDEINNLTMTALDFIGVLEHFGLDYATQIKPFLEAQPNLDKQLKYCQNVWCGVAKQIFTVPITIGNITVTADMVEQAFIAKGNV